MSGVLGHVRCGLGDVLDDGIGVWGLWWWLLGADEDVGRHVERNLVWWRWEFDVGIWGTGGFWGGGLAGGDGSDGPLSFFGRRCLGFFSVGLWNVTVRGLVEKSV